MTERPTNETTQEQTTLQVQDPPVTAADPAQAPAAPRAASRPRIPRQQCAC